MLMGQVKSRLKYVETTFPELLDTVAGLQDERAMRMEALAGQLRKILELIVYSALLANERAAAEVLPDIGSMQKAKKILYALGRINPHFFPAPVIVDVIGPQNKHLRERPGNDSLTKDEFAPLFDACSRIVHETNPFAPHDAIVFPRPRASIQRIRNLLEVHVAKISNDQALLVQMGDWHQPGVMAFALAAT